MRFEKYLTEKQKVTGFHNKDKILKQVEKYRKDLRKLTKIFRSLDKPEDSRDIKEWKEVRKYYQRFRNSFEEWVYSYLLTKKNPSNENYLESEVRSKCWTALMDITGIFKEGYDAPSKQHGLDPSKTIKQRENIIRTYNSSFNKAFKVIEEMIEQEDENFERVQQIKKFNYEGVNIILDIGEEDKEYIDKWLPEMEDFIKNLKSLMKRVKEKGLGDLLKNLNIKLSLSQQGAAGYYDFTDDEIIMTIWSFSGDTRNKVFFHELAHRYYYKYLPEELRDKWKEAIRLQDIKITQEHVNNFIDKYYPFTQIPGIKNIGDNEEDVRNFLMSKGESSENIAVYAHLIENFPFSLKSKLDRGDDIKEKIRNRYNDIVGETISSQFISEYANSNPDEAWAEAVAIWLTYHLGRLPDRVRYILKSIFESLGVRINESRLQKHLLNEFKSIHQVKKEFRETALDFIKKLARVYNISNVYDIKISSKMGHSGACDRDNKTIEIKTSAMDTDTLYHELAHWIQRERDGIKSFCTGMDRFKDYDPEVARKHTKLQRAIGKIAKDMGFDEKLREIVAS